jgi:hypothetical protein
MTPPRPLPSLIDLLAAQPAPFFPTQPNLGLGREPLRGWGMAERQIIDGHHQLLGWNPMYIDFHRYTRGRDGAAFSDWVEDPPAGIPNVLCRIYLVNAGGGSSNVSDINAGHQERDTSWGIMMHANVPLRVTDGEDGNVKIELWHPVHGRFRLRRLRPLESRGYIFGWQGDLERIAGTGPKQRVPYAAVPLPPEPPTWPNIPGRPPSPLVGQTQDEYERRRTEWLQRARYNPAKIAATKVPPAPGTE